MKNWKPTLIGGVPGLSLVAKDFNVTGKVRILMKLKSRQQRHVQKLARKRRIEVQTLRTERNAALREAYEARTTLRETVSAALTRWTAESFWTRIMDAIFPVRVLKRPLDV